jgi:hypothetical protein
MGFSLQWHRPIPRSRKLCKIIVYFHETSRKPFRNRKRILENCKIDHFGFQPYKLYKKRILQKCEVDYFRCQPCTLYKVDNQHDQFRIFAKFLFRFPRNFVRIHNCTVGLPLEAGSCGHEPESVHQSGITHMNPLPVLRAFFSIYFLLHGKMDFFNLKMIRPVYDFMLQFILVKR